jgi:hypothetical protein
MIISSPNPDIQFLMSCPEIWLQVKIELS